MKLCTLASSSSGNCILISSGTSHLLVDCGISCRRITASLRALEVDPRDLLGVFITHEHSDHIAGLATLVRSLGLPVFFSPGTSLELRRRFPFPPGTLRELEPAVPMELGPFRAAAFPTSHDAAQSTGFTFSAEGRTAAVATDLGHVTDAVLGGVLGSHLVVCESNHDVDLLRTGSYPYYLKQRILGDRGHLSNEAGAALALQCVQHGAGTVLLAHLSQQNNTPALALAASSSVFRAAGVEPGRDVRLTVAPAGRPSEVFEV